MDACNIGLKIQKIIKCFLFREKNLAFESKSKNFGVFLHRKDLNDLFVRKMLTFNCLIVDRVNRRKHQMFEKKNVLRTSRISGMYF